jgi:hypothetical protein
MQTMSELSSPYAYGVHGTAVERAAPFRSILQSDNTLTNGVAQQEEMGWSLQHNLNRSKVGINKAMATSTQKQHTMTA